ncbi:MAG TPA: M91 family zinc metallopeptidase [Bryobacteraceae bacterium]|nr:M91 family zinc metallopeptidase [Bryobacteraceae bacterium]
MPGFPAARQTDFHMCPMFDGPKPHVGGPITAPCMPTVLIGGLPAARISDIAICAGPPDVITKGAATVLIGGLPAARMTDITTHGGMILSPCAPNVLIGDPAFSVPANITIKGAQAFMTATVRDLYYLSTLPSGKTLLNRLAASGQPVVIVEHTGTNGFCTPDNGTHAQDGTGTGSTVQYNPSYRSNAYDSSGNLIAQPPQMILGHELTHALANAEGHQASGTDPSPPASEPTIDAEESQAIGTGSYNGTSPSENSLRNDAGLPRRDNHYGTGGPAAGEPAPLNLRPGQP